MVNFVPGFVSDDCGNWDAERRRRGSAAEIAPPRRHGRASKPALKAWEAGQSAPGGHGREVADHVEHVAKVAGHDHVGIGADLDGIPYHARPG